MPERIEYEVTGIRPNHRQEEFICSYSLDRFQWMLKLLNYLKYKGFTSVKYKKVPVEVKMSRGKKE